MVRETGIYTVIDAYSPWNIFGDLRIAFVWLACAILCIYIPVLNESVFRFIITLPLVIFVPGYALIAALFPSRHIIGVPERLALSFGISILIIPVIGLVLNITAWGIKLNPVVLVLATITTVLLIVAQFRRYILPPDDRYCIPVEKTFRAWSRDLFPAGQSKIDRFLSMIIVIFFVTALVGIVSVIMIPKDGEHYTEFYVLGKEGLAADYPSDFAVGELQTVILGIGNHEHRTVSYTVEVYLFDMEFDALTNRSALRDSRLLDLLFITVDHNETRELPFDFRIDSTYYNRVQFLLFADAVPADDVTGIERVNESYRDLHLWVDVQS